MTGSHLSEIEGSVLWRKNRKHFSRDLVDVSVGTEGLLFARLGILQ